MSQQRGPAAESQVTQRQSTTSPRVVMLGAGAYDQHSKLQAGVLQLAAGRLENAALAVLTSGASTALGVADYGSATGKNSIAAIHFLAEVIARHRLAAPLSLHFCDQPDNDWKVLAARLSEAFAERDDVAYGMFPRSFYGPVLPPRSVDIGWSAIAVHWLSAWPSEAIDGLWPHGGLGPRRAAFAEQARRDWSVFLAQRARELRADGQLIVIAACSRADGTSTADAYLDIPWEILQELEREGALTAGERAAMHVPTYFRSAAEWRAPFGEPDLPLELVDYAEELLPDALWAAYERSGDGAAFADAWVGWLRAFTEPLLSAALHPERDAAQRRALLDELYRRTAARIVREPERARIPWTLALLHTARK